MNEHGVAKSNSERVKNVGKMDAVREYEIAVELN